MTTKRKRGKRAKKVQSRRAKITGFPTDAESIELRRERAEKEKTRVTRRGPDEAFYGEFDVASSQWNTPYLVIIRSLTAHLNSCSCQDFRMNGLGTCKHIERTLQFLQHRRKRRFKAAAQAGCPTWELFFDTRESPPTLRLMQPEQVRQAVKRALGPLFSVDGTALGAPTDTWTAMELSLSKLPKRDRATVRCSPHADYWLARMRHKADREQLRERFERDVAEGKRSDNPVNLPLYPYQKSGMRHLAFNGRAMLADEMGLGKTVQAIAAAQLLRQLGRVKRVLVVSPASLKAEWEDQIRQFTGIQAKPIFGSRAERLRTYAEAHTFSLSNYEQIRNDVDAINRLMLPDLVILDEAQRIKNWPTKTAKTIKRLQSPYAFVLTGTPLENRIEEFYSLVEFIDPHLFGSLFRFQREYIEITPENEHRPKNLDNLHRVASTVMLRRRKKDVEGSLPERSDKTFYVEMTHEQRVRYREYEYEAAKLAAIAKRRPLKKEEHDRLQIMLGCMRMLCDTPFILDAECRHCPKLEEMENILEEITTDDDANKILIFSEWVRMLDLVGELLDEMNIGYTSHTGRVPQKKRREHIARFKTDPGCRVFLSSESGGAGLNLQAANVVINIDLPWNPAKLEQRIARAWRKHQKRSVRVVNLVTTESIEFQMQDKLAYKTALADSVLDGAAFKEQPRTTSGRNAFVARVNALLGGDARSVAAQETKRQVPPKEKDIKASLTARFADSILGIEQHEKNGSTVVVARPGSNLETLRENVDAESKGKAMVVTPEIKEMLLRLQEMGMLTLAPEIAAVHADKGYTPLKAKEPEPPRLHYKAARDVWQVSAPELKAAKTLGGLGLADQAAPHLEKAVAAGRRAIITLYDANDKALPEHAAPAHRELFAQLSMPGTLNESLTQLDTVTRILSSSEHF